MLFVGQYAHQFLVMSWAFALETRHIHRNFPENVCLVDWSVAVAVFLRPLFGGTVAVHHIYVDCFFTSYSAVASSEVAAVTLFCMSVPFTMRVEN